MWTTGALSLSGSAELSIAIGVQAGIGTAKGANLHLQADFGPEFAWTSGKGCDLLLNLGSLSAGEQVFGGETLSTPPFTPFKLHLWSGCASVTAIAAGSDHTCALVAGGQVDCWGLGNGTATGPDTCFGLPCSTTPVRVAGISGATAIADDTTQACAVVAGGQIDCWTYPARTPVRVAGISGATAITAGEAGAANLSAGHTCALVAGGQIECWGNNGDGQLGNGTTSDSLMTPVRVAGISGATAIAAGRYHTCAVVAGGQVDCWGHNQSGELGNGTTTARTMVACAAQGRCGWPGSAARPRSPPAISHMRGGRRRAGRMLGREQRRGAGERDHDRRTAAAPARRPVRVAGISGATAIAAGGKSRMRGGRRRAGRLLGRQQRRATRERDHDGPNCGGLLQRKAGAGGRDQRRDRDRRRQCSHVRAGRRRTGRMLGRQPRRGSWGTGDHRRLDARPGERHPVAPRIATRALRPRCASIRPYPGTRFGPA